MLFAVYIYRGIKFFKNFQNFEPILKNKDFIIVRAKKHKRGIFQWVEFLNAIRTRENLKLKEEKNYEKNFKIYFFI